MAGICRRKKGRDLYLFNRCMSILESKRRRCCLQPYSSAKTPQQGEREGKDHEGGLLPLI